MSRDEGQTVVPNGPDNYESVVLDFLDKEMAAVKPDKKKNEHSDELDALVSDLLKQVLIETDAPKAARPEKSREMEDLLEEFPPVEVKPQASATRVPKAEIRLVEPSVKSVEPDGIASESKSISAELDGITFSSDDSSFEYENALFEAEKRESAVKSKSAPSSVGKSPEPEIKAVESPARTEELPTENKQDIAVATAEEAVAPRPSTSLAAPTFGVPAASKSRMPMIAVAAAGLLAIIGGAGYYFLGSSKAGSQVAESQPAPTRPNAISVAPPAPEPVNSAVSTKQDPAPAKTTPQAASSIAKSEPVKPAAVSNVALPAPPQEKPSLLQSGTPMAAAAAGSALDKLMPTSAPDRPKPPVAPRNAAASNAPAASNAQPVVSGTLVPASPVYKVTPKYPALAAKTHASASVALDLVIDEKGNVVDATPVNGPSMFHKEAVDAVMKWRYKPASLGGVNVKSQTRVTMIFKLK